MFHGVPPDIIIVSLWSRRSGVRIPSATPTFSTGYDNFPPHEIEVKAEKVTYEVTAANEQRGKFVRQICEMKRSDSGGKCLCHHRKLSGLGPPYESTVRDSAGVVAIVHGQLDL